MNYTTNSGYPTANITINKSRIKVYNPTTGYHSNGEVYLETGQEFELELFNPTSKTVLAKISLNGVLTSQNGLVLRPGERVFLERYLDIAKKFRFETYSVANTQEVKNAIRNNGDVKIEFFNEYTPPYYYGNTYLTTGNGNWNNPFIGTCRTATYTSGITNTSFKCCSDSLSDTPRELETGRVEAGTDSGQQFDYVNKSFDSWASCTVSYKMLPTSQKPVTIQEIRNYCSNCGTRAKSNYKFCPSCGSKV